MIELININKTYHSKANQVTNALSNINLKLPNKGLVFVLGPSGSGKSTLLNIIGGIETATQGEFRFNQTIVSQKPDELDEYRNQHISFVFQSFNLISHLNVYDNLEIVCFDQKDKEQIPVVLEKVGLNGYEKRYTSELSGGEIQRVAIARALLKKSHVLLADEPTGNLNKENAVQVMSILKEISQTQLVIVVTHNESLSQEFADREVKLADGKIISDSNSNIQSNISTENENKQSNNLSFSKIFKITKSHMLARKKHLVLMLLALIVTFLVITSSYLFVDFDRSLVDSNNIINTEETYFSIYRNEGVSTTEVKQIIENQSFTYLLNNYIESKSQMENFGYIFYDGATEITSDSVYLSDDMVHDALSNGLIIRDLILREEVSVSTSYDEISGCYIVEDDQYYLISGVYNTDFDNINFTRLTGLAYQEKTTYYLNYIYKPLFYTYNGKYDLSQKKSIYVKNDDTVMTKDIIFNNKVLNQGLNVIDEFSSSSSLYGQVVLNDEGILFDSSLIDQGFSVTSDHDIYITLDLYNELYNYESNPSYYVSDLNYNPVTEVFERTVFHYPTHIGDTISFSIIDDKFNVSIDYNQYVLRGIIINQYSDPNDTIFYVPTFGILIDSEIVKDIYDFSRINEITIKTDSIDDLYKFAKSIKENYQIDLLYSYSQNVTDFENSIDNTIYVFYIVTGLMFVLVILINVLGISNQIKMYSKENGILRAIGIKKSNIEMIYILQIIMTSIFTIIFVILCSMLMTYLLNNYVVNNLTDGFNLLLYKPIYILYIVCIVFIVNAITSLAAIYQSMRMNPYHVIRNNE